MPTFSRRLNKASEESLRASHRIAKAEGKIVRTIVEMLGDDENQDQPTPPRPSKNVTPPKTKPPRK